MVQLVAKVQSDTDEDVLYNVVRTTQGKLACPCKAFRIQAQCGANGLECKHISRARPEIERAGVKLPLSIPSPFWTRRSPKEIWRRGNEVKPAQIDKISTGDPILDELLGGGLAKGHTAFLTGGPGGGKSILCGRMGGAIAAGGRTVLYAVGEEPSENFLARLAHYGIGLNDRILIGDTHYIGDIESGVEKFRPEVMFTDSLQAHTFHPGQARTPLVEQNIMQRLIKLARVKHIAHVCIGHQTKSGEARGGMTLQHDADATIKIYKDPEIPQERVIYVDKNRSGPNGVSVRYLLTRTELKIMEDRMAAMGQEIVRLTRQLRDPEGEGDEPTALAA